MVDNGTGYREEIEPLIERIVLICKQTGKGFYCSCESKPSVYADTYINVRKDRVDKLVLHQLVSESADIDDLIIRLIDLVEQNQLPSLFLKTLGIG